MSKCYFFLIQEPRRIVLDILLVTVTSGRPAVYLRFIWLKMVQKRYVILKM